MKIEEGYKVIHKHINGQRVSCIYGIASTVYYIPDKFVEPRDGEGPLAVFRSLKDVRNFCRFPNKNREIWKCEYEPSTGKNLFSYKCEWMRGKRKERHIVNLPLGTKLARRVKLIKKVG